MLSMVKPSRHLNLPCSLAPLTPVHDTRVHIIQAFARSVHIRVHIIDAFARSVLTYRLLSRSHH